MRLIQTSIACLALSVACTGNDTLPPEELEQGLNILEEADGQIAGAYVEGDQLVYFEAVRGPRTPQVLRDNGVAPEYEVDSRFRDRDGNTFLMQVGGHAAMDPTWNPDLGLIVDTERRAVEIRLAELAGQALAQHEFEADVGGEVSALLALGELMVNPSIAKPPAPTSPPQIDPLYSHGYWHAVQIHKKCLWYTACIGDHSSTLSWYAQSSASEGFAGWTTAIDNTDHGDYASSMGFKCGCITGWSTGRTNHVHAESECWTPYGFDSYYGAHNCNDDAELQFESTVKNYHVYSGGGQDGNGSCDNGSMNNKSECDQNGCPQPY